MDHDSALFFKKLFKYSVETWKESFLGSVELVTPPSRSLDIL